MTKSRPVRKAGRVVVFGVAAPIWLREPGPPRLAAGGLSRFYRLAAAGRPNLAQVPLRPGKTAAVPSPHLQITR